MSTRVIRKANLVYSEAKKEGIRLQSRGYNVRIKEDAFGLWSLIAVKARGEYGLLFTHPYTKKY